MKQYFKTCVVCEGKLAGAFLSRVLPPELVSKTRMLTTWGHSSALTLTRSVLFEHKQSNVVLFAHADTIGSRRVEEQMDFIHDYLTPVPDYRQRLLILLLQPDFITYLFSVKAVVHRHWPDRDGQPAIDLAPIARGDAFLLETQAKELIGQLDNCDIDAYRETPQIKQVIDALEAVNHSHARA